MNGVSTKVLKPEPSHWVHDIPISNKTLQRGERSENIEQAKGNECSQLKSTADAAGRNLC
jgi:hypothetical protein